MITEKDLMEAIAECQGQRNPNANTCIKLAAYYTILDHVREEKHEDNALPAYSFSASPNPALDRVYFQGDGEFAEVVQGMDSQEVWSVVNELMNTLSIINPKLYNSVMRKIKGGL